MEAKRKNDGRRGEEWETEKMKRTMDEKNNQKKGVRYWEENSGFNYYRIDNPFPLEEEKKNAKLVRDISFNYLSFLFLKAKLYSVWVSLEQKNVEKAKYIAFYLCF